MFRNYLLVAVRNIWRNKMFSLLNMLGLVVGISAALVVYLVVWYEAGFNKQQQDKDRIYRIVSTISFSGDSVRNSGVTVPVVQVVRENIPQVEKTIHFLTDDITGRITVDGKDFRNKEDIIFADSSYMDMMGYQWLSGSPATALKQPFSVVLTKEKANTYFPRLSPAAVVGKEIVYDDSIRTTVTGVVADLPYRTDFWFREIVSMSTVYASQYRKEVYAVDNWTNTSSSSQLLVKLKAGVDPKQATALLAKYMELHNDKSSRTSLWLQPLQDIHFNRNYYAYKRTADRQQLYMLSVIAVALLILAVINFINLTTAQAARRAKETGIRKAIGGTMRQLMIQFLGETLVLTFTAAVIALLMAPVLIKCFHDFLPEDLPAMQLYSLQVLLFLLLLAVVVALLSGIYPAYVLARFQPVMVLKSQTGAAGNKAWLRQTLTATQFMVAQFFIIATLVVSKQIHYSLNKDLGFRKDAILTVATPPRDENNSLRNRLQAGIAALPEVEVVSLSNRSPIINGFMTSVLDRKDGRKAIEKVVEMRYVDSSYLKVYQLKLLAGRNLMNSDTVREWLLNENAVRAFGFKRPEDAVGELISGKPVVGVVKNFNAGNLHREIPVLALGSAAAKSHRTLHIRLHNAGEGGIVWKKGIAGIEKVWKEIYPREEFSYEFLDKTIENLYRNELRTAGLLNWCSGLAVFISALGLLGLVVFTTNQRTREIGIRKVLGASVWQVIRLLTKDFMKPVLVAFLLAVPLSWWVMNKWLQSFVYRTGLSWWIFAAGGMIMVILALATMSIKTVRSALSNPVDALKTE
ncbi:ABC transporter permease [Chitinophaga sp. HK235]|uniref:ABC transporter permease n=1 Tax=Chitinophaga sp. HK235 TaxID=2952571 RepID=UPI001BAA36C0|nr:ABC transporter permease [Chitinophaga sp. HK235]